jgi:RimJ/RimL family protein N-acetyltransferase
MLADYFPDTICNQAMLVTLEKMKHSHLPALYPLTTDKTKPLQWFYTEIQSLQGLVQLESHVVYTIIFRDQVAGFFYLKSWHDVAPSELEMGYCLLESFRGKGVLERTLLTALPSLFGLALPNGEVLEQICLFVDSENYRSKGSLAKLGMTRLKDTQDEDDPSIIYHHYVVQWPLWEQVEEVLKERAKTKCYP